ncbi:FabD/lysophospholipase-like protein [Mycena venus]|uniref:FabD/lysophospholipase-like protein n=1 Tax=Mycena venus TaxID=2733690 RepID=A0A8H7DBT9_9AGAR|nr:FabD/lysophospholipase-like protein [Mycena venus]
MDLSSTGHHITIHGGTGGSGGQGGNVGGAGGNAEGPQFTVSGAENLNVTVHGDLINHFPPPRNLDSWVHSEVRNDRKLCPMPVSFFTGRKDILQKMSQYFDRDQGSMQHIFVLHGLGGSGKSQLAFKFLEESKINCRFSEILYIDATSEQTVEMDLQTIACAAVGKSPEASLHWLAGKQEEWLLFFDNADDAKLDISKFFPRCTFGNILITTRNQELCTYASVDADSKVSNMDLDDAKDLLLRLSRQVRSDDQEKLAVTIVKELHCFALAVSQAGCYIQRHCTLSKYLKLYQSHRDHLLQQANIQGQTDYGLAVYATWDLSYNRLSSAGRSLLQICSILHHTGITEEMFEKAAMCQENLDDPDLQDKVTLLLTGLGKRDGNWDSVVFLELMGELASYSLIELDRQNDSYTIHPLVQQWSGMTMGTDRHLIQRCVHTIIGLSIAWSFNEEDYKYRRKLLVHATKSGDSFDLEEIPMFVAYRIGRVYWEAGQWKQAETLLVAVMETRKRTLGEEHPDTLTSFANLALTYWSQGRWKDAEALQVVVMETSKHMLGEEDPETLRSIAHLATTYWNQGRWKDAEALEVVVMEISKHVLGEEHPSTLTSMANLASTYWNQGRWKDAEALEVVVMEISKHVLGEEHPDTLTRMANLALTYWSQGHWKEAELLQVADMETSKRVLGEEHPDTLMSTANLALTYWSQGRWKDAEALQVAVVDTSKRVLGEEHPETLRTIANLAATYQSQGRWNDAEALQVAVVKTSKRVLGEEHPDTLIKIADLASTYWSQGRWKDAEVLQVAVVEASKRVLGEEHPDTLTWTANLASTYQSQGC